MAVDRWLVDKSALVRLGASSMAEEWAARIQRGLVHVCGITLLEVGFSARSSEDLRESVIQPPISHMPVEYLTPGIENRAREVQAMLAVRGQHRGPSVPDLLIAATAELKDLVILHVDKGYQLISEIAGQRQEWLAMEEATKRY